MRRLLLLTLSFAAFPLACVNSDPAPVFVDVSYQLRCIDCEPRTADDSAHTINALDGENGFRVTCDSQRQGKDRLVTFSAGVTDSKHPSNSYAFKIFQADVDKSDPGSSCHTQVVEGSNSYDGPCSSGEPSSDRPCQLKLKLKDGVIKGSVLCNAIPNRNDSMLTRHLVSPWHDRGGAVRDPRLPAVAVVSVQKRSGAA